MEVGRARNDTRGRLTFVYNSDWRSTPDPFPLAAVGFRQMIAYIEAGNDPSISLHENFGFVGELKSVGYKFGRSTDSVMLQRPLGDGDATPPLPGEGALPEE